MVFVWSVVDVLDWSVVEDCVVDELGCEEPDVPDVDEGLVELDVPLAPLIEPDDWLLEAPCESDDEEFVLDDCWLASAPLVTLWDPLPTFTPGLTFAPMFAFELLTPTLASTPTFGFTLSVFDVDELELGLLDEELELLGLVELLPALTSIELAEELLEGLDARSEPVTPTLVELEVLDGEDDVAPLRLMLFELEELDGVDALPFRLMSVELEELEGAGLAPRTLISVELELLDGTDAPLIVVDDELDPGRTATPGVTSVTVLPLDWASGTLGTQPAGVVFAVSMHLGSSRPLDTLVTVSARAAPNAARSDAARRLMVKVFLFIALPPDVGHIPLWHRPG